MRKLDFIVFGLARSGTTALTNLLRANRRIFCGAEFFTPQADHSRIDVPQAFFDEEARLERNGAVPAHIRVSMEILRRRQPGEIVLYGNKWPLYSHFFDRVMSEIAAPRAIMAYRNYRACAGSYARRSQDANDGWPTGRGGFFAGVEMLHIVKILARSPHADTLIVPQAHLARDWRKTLGEVSEYLLPGRPLEIDDAVVARLERNRRNDQKQPRKPLTAQDQEIFSLLDAAGVNDIFPQDRCLRLGDVQDALRRAAERLPQDHVGFCRTLAEGYEDPGVIRYFETWQDLASRAEAPPA